MQIKSNYVNRPRNSFTEYVTIAMGHIIEGREPNLALPHQLLFYCVLLYTSFTKINFIRILRPRIAEV